LSGTVRRVIERPASGAEGAAASGASASGTGSGFAGSGVSAVSAGSAGPAGEVWRAMQALLMGGEQRNRIHEICQDVDLTPAALKMLMVLADGPRPMRELVGAFRVDPSYLTGVVDTLERRGAARREPHPTDRRAKTVALTDLGLRLAGQARELMAVPPASFDVLSQAEQEQLLALLLRIVDAEPDIPAAMRPTARPTPAA